MSSRNVRERSQRDASAKPEGAKRPSSPAGLAGRSEERACKLVIIIINPSENADTSMSFIINLHQNDKEGHKLSKFFNLIHLNCCNHSEVKKIGIEWHNKYFINVASLYDWVIMFTCWHVERQSVFPSFNLSVHRTHLSQKHFH